MKAFKDAYTTRELIKLFGLSKPAVLSRAKRESWCSRKRQGRGGGNEWLVDSMPHETRLVIAQHEAEEAACKVQASDVLQALELPSLNCAPSEPSAMTGKQQLRVESRAMLLHIFDTWRQAAGLPMSRARALFCELYNTTSESLSIPDWVREGVAHVSPNSLYNWGKAVKEDGITRLGGKYGQHRKGQGIIDRNDEMRELIMGLLYKYPDISAKNVMRGLKARFDKGECPSMRTLSRWMADYRKQNDSLIMRVSNPDGWRSKHLTAIGSASEDVHRLNQLWEYDSTVADVMLADGKRHAIVAIIDVWSRRVKFHVSRTSKTSAIKALTRRCILDWGVPEVAKTDNGADYVSREMQRCFLWLGIEQRLCTPFNPQEKPHVERVFKTFLHGVFELLEGFVGHNVIDRKAIESRRAFADRLFKKEHRDAPLEMRLTQEELQEFCDHWTQNIYERDVHQSLGMTPFQKVSTWTEPVARVEGDAERKLDILLSPAAGNDGWRTVSKKGLKVGGYHYAHPILWVEDAVPGGRVRVLLDEADAGYVFCFNESGGFVCRAMCPELLGIPRQQLATACKRAQKEYLSGATKGLSQAAKRARVDTILTDIMTHAAQGAAKVQALPHPAKDYDTPALQASKDAFTATQAPEPQKLSAELQARQKELKKSFVTPLPVETAEEREQRLKQERFARACELEERLEAGETLSDEEVRFLTGYRTLPEYRTQKAHQEHLRQFMSQTRKEAPAAQNG